MLVKLECGFVVAADDAQHAIDLELLECVVVDHVEPLTVNVSRRDVRYHARPVETVEDGSRYDGVALLQTDSDGIRAELPARLCGDPFAYAGTVY